MSIFLSLECSRCNASLTSNSTDIRASEDTCCASCSFKIQNCCVLVAVVNFYKLLNPTVNLNNLNGISEELWEIVSTLIAMHCYTVVCVVLIPYMYIHLTSF